MSNQSLNTSLNSSSGIQINCLYNKSQCTHQIWIDAECLPSPANIQHQFKFGECIPTQTIHTHTNPRERLKWPYAITRWTANFMCGLMSDMVNWKFRTKYGYTWHQMSWDQVSLSNTNQTRNTANSLRTADWWMIFHRYVHIYQTFLGLSVESTSRVNHFMDGWDGWWLSVSTERWMTLHAHVTLFHDLSGELHVNSLPLCSSEYMLWMFTWYNGWWLAVSKVNHEWHSVP